MPPPIRYPLPTLIAALVLGLAVWRGEAMTRPLRSAVATRIGRMVAGPPVPASDRPQVVAGPIVRKVLLLHDEVAVSARPGGPLSDSIRLRMFVEVYDVWPTTGPVTHYRVGNRRPIGWVQAEDVLAWDTRLVVAPSGPMALADAPDRPTTAVAVGPAAFPVVGWTDRAVEVAVWERDAPWGRVGRRGWAAPDSIPSDRWGVWLSRDEVLGLLRRTLDPRPGDSPEMLRLLAVLGRLSDDRAPTEADLAAARNALPSSVFGRPATPLADASERLAEVNERWKTEAEWAGFQFRRVPLDVLP